MCNRIIDSGDEGEHFLNQPFSLILQSFHLGCSHNDQIFNGWRSEDFEIGGTQPPFDLRHPLFIGLTLPGIGGIGAVLPIESYIGALSRINYCIERYNNWEALADHFEGLPTLFCPLDWYELKVELLSAILKGRSRLDALFLEQFGHHCSKQLLIFTRVG